MWVLVQVCVPASSGSLTGHTTLHATSEQFSETGADLSPLPTTGGDVPGLDSFHPWFCLHLILAINRCDLREFMALFTFSFLITDGSEPLSCTNARSALVLIHLHLHSIEIFAVS